MIKIRKATEKDIEPVSDIYNAIHDEIEHGRYAMKWFRDMYPTRQWALERLAAGDLYVMDEGGRFMVDSIDDEMVEGRSQIVASAVINHNPLPEYFIGKWHQPQDYSRIMILHTLVVHPRQMHKGYATAFVNYFEDMAREEGCERVRLDTQAIDVPARQLYRKLGYTEADRVPCEFKGITDIDLCLIEKIL